MNVNLKDFIKIISDEDRKQLYLLLSIEFKRLNINNGLMTIDYLIKNYDMSARLTNALKHNCICDYQCFFRTKEPTLVYVHQLNKKSVSSWRNVGKKTIEELFFLIENFKKAGVI
jgi:hypothetical protein